MVNYIKNYKENKTTNKIISYLDAKSDSLATYQMFEIYTYHLDQNT